MCVCVCITTEFLACRSVASHLEVPKGHVEHNLRAAAGVKKRDLFILIHLDGHWLRGTEGIFRVTPLLGAALPWVLLAEPCPECAPMKLARVGLPTLRSWKPAKCRT